MPRPETIQPEILKPTPYQNRLGARNQLARMAWLIVWNLLYRPSPNLLHAWRRFLLRSFGAKIGSGAHPYPRCRIWAPWNLTMGADSCLANDVDCYCVAPIELGAWAIVSQYSYLCSATHDYQASDFPLIFNDDVPVVASGPTVTVPDSTRINSMLPDVVR